MSHTAIDQARFRQVLGHFPTGVTVVTSVHDGDHVGLAVGSFFSVSLDPALVGFCVGRQSASWPRIRAAGRFCVNVLGEHQEDVCRVFASKVADKFDGLGFDAAPFSGAPRIHDVLAWIDCEIDSVLPAGDHDIVVGRVHDLGTLHQGAPLVFFRGGYANLGR